MTGWTDKVVVPFRKVIVPVGAVVIGVVMIGPWCVPVVPDRVAVNLTGLPNTWEPSGVAVRLVSVVVPGAGTTSVPFSVRPSSPPGPEKRVDIAAEIVQPVVAKSGTVIVESWIVTDFVVGVYGALEVKSTGVAFFVTHVAAMDPKATWTR